MKNVTYMGQVFEVPDEAKFIAADWDGNVYTYVLEPSLQDVRYIPHLDDEDYERVGELDRPLPPCEAI